MIYSKEQIFLMTLKEACSVLNLTKTTFQVDSPAPMFEDAEQHDKITNQLLWLEDHILTLT
jgi:hypothetical protein